MRKVQYKFSDKTTTYYFDAEFSNLEKLVEKEHAVIITDENIFKLHRKKFSGWNTIILKAGEFFKSQATVDSIIEQLIAFKADRKTYLIGVGGGVVTDTTGYVASVYMRGLSFGFVPGSVLAMVDASIGGKNGIDVGLYKNLVGTIRQPDFLLYDFGLLKSLPKDEWINGFAEIIKEYTDFKDTDRVIAILKKYGLPTRTEFEPKKVLKILKMDKKKVKDSINYVLLNKIGQGIVKTIPIIQLEKLVQSIITAR
jgi:3-dehydroquinate synthetase